MPTAHIIGAGLSGLAAATSLAERNIPVNLYESQSFAGGRARSSSIGKHNQPFDHGIYSILGSYKQTWKLIERVQANSQWQKLPVRYDYMDLHSQETWSLKSPLFLPHSPLIDYLKPLRLMSSRKDVPITDIIDPFHPLYETWVTPLTRMALGTTPDQASARQFATVLRRTILKGRGAATRFVPRHTIHQSLISPALQFLEAHGISTYFGHTLKHMEGNGRISKLAFTRKHWPIGEKDIVILATPPHVTQTIDPSISVPERNQSIITLHFMVPHREPDYRMLGFVGGSADYMLFRADHIVAVCHAAEHLFNLDNQTLAERIWKQIRVALAYLPQAAPPFQILKERKAGFVSAPHLKRPSIHTNIPNLFVAGDYTATHLPASMEGAVLSGHLAAEAAIKAFRHH